jgi:hypothetical protein
VSRKRRGSKRKATRKNPARMVQEKAKKLRYRQPDATEQIVQAVVAEVRQAIHDGAEKDGVAGGLLKVAAKHLTGQLQARYGLEGDVHNAAIIAYLHGAWGEIAHAFPEKPDLPSYAEQRERSVEIVREALGR